ncbi:MAG: hypothetical protein JWO13_2510 [Acidobacteriales bacterium]|nr:hypothetical protein [Terriglobales bacterium]
MSASFLTLKKISVQAVILTSLLASSLAGSAKLQITPTTTLAAETGNNTSASDTVGTLTQGYAASGNMSKLPIRSLTYPGANTKIYAALMGWFGKSSHISVGYKSSDANQVKKQVEDMQSRGIEGAIIAWYGAGTGMENITAQQLRLQAEAHPGFTFAIMVDQGTIQWNSMGLSPTDALIYHLNYVAQNYYPSTAYMRMNGRPVVFDFGLEAWPIDWTKVVASVQGNPVFIFRNPVGFSHAFSGGAYSWGPAGGLAYTDYFDKIAATFPTMPVYGDASKGFNDVLASWSQQRVVDQQCGQTWLNTLAETGKFYSSTKQLPYLQVATWNDYEEGTSIESGIDNCVSVSASMSGTSVQWWLTGAGLENTIDHYTAFISIDGTNLMSLGDFPVSTHILDLSQFNLAPGSYSIVVKAVAKASLKNQMSSAVSYIVPNLPPTAVLNITPSSGIAPVTVSASSVGSSDVDGMVVASQINFGDGSTATGSTASHVYSVPGTYTVSAMVTDDLGASATSTSIVTVIANQAPKAALNVTPSSGIAPVIVSASTAGSSDSDGIVASSQIDFGDGTVVAGSSATHVYNVPGTFTITAKVTDDRGATSTAISVITVVVNQAPKASLTITPSSGVAPVTVLVSTVGSSDVDGTVVSSQIDFGDGTVVTGSSASHLYKSAGLYTVIAKLTDNMGATSTTTRSVTVAAPSVIISQPANGATVSSSVRVVASASSGLPTTGMWVYLDNVGVYSVYSGSLDTTLKLSAGKHTIQVKAWDSSGNITSSSVVITVPTSGTALVRPLRSSRDTTAAATTTTAATPQTADSTISTDVSISRSSRPMRLQTLPQ